MKKGFVSHKLKVLLLEFQSYLGDGLVFGTIGFSEN